MLLGSAASVASAWAVRHQIDGGARLGAMGSVVMQVASLPSDVKLARSNIGAVLPDAAPALQAREQRFGTDAGFKFTFPSESRVDMGYLLRNRYDGGKNIRCLSYGTFDRRRRYVLGVFRRSIRFGRGHR